MWESSERRRPFRDRAEAGRTLAAHLQNFANRDDVVVLALPRGGVTVGYEVALALHAPLEVFVVRKLGAPGQPELALGAIASGGVRVLNDEIVAQLSNAAQVLDRIAAEEQRELERREREYRAGRPPPDLQGKVVILADDGLATGATMRAAARALHQFDIARCVVAVPVGAPETCRAIAAEVDEVICAIMPLDFHGVGQFYRDFAQTTDAEVCELLTRAALRRL